MEERKRIILNSKKSKNNIDEDIIIRQDILHTNKMLPVEELIETVDVTEVFKDERNQVNDFRFMGNINIVSSNVLFNWDGICSYEQIKEARIFNPVTGEYVYTQEEILLEDDGWFYYLTGETAGITCDKKYLEPLQDRWALYNFSGTTNWNLWLTYPAEVDEQILVFNDVPITSGIAIYSGTSVTIDDRVMTAFICSINHGLDVDDEIELSGLTITGYEGVHRIYQIGFGDGSYLFNAFIVDINLGVPPSFIGTQTSFKRRVDKIASEYHGRWFKKINRISEVETFNTAYASNVYKDQIYSYTFNKDYDLTDIRDYLGRPITEVYLSIVKKQDYSTGSAFWTTVESGLKTMLQGSEYDINTMTSNVTGDSIESDLNNSSDLIFGDIVEYNAVDQTEEVLEVGYHRFNTKNREDNNFLEGYYYKPHYKMQLRHFSAYVDTAFSGETDIPDYATIFPDGRVTWRDILPNDFSNGTAIPFLNGSHYKYDCFNVLVQRQDPCYDFEIGAKSLVTGDCDTNEQFNETEPVDICADDLPFFEVDKLKQFNPLNFL